MSRISDFQKIVAREKLNGFIVSNSVNIFYLTSFKGVSPTEREATLVFNPHPTLVTSRLYQNEAKKLQSKNLSIIIVDDRKQWNNSLKKLVANSKKIGFEAQDLRVSEYKEFNKLLSNSKLIPLNLLIEKLRLYKSQVELQYIEKAQIISQKAFDSLIKTIKPGQTEIEIADRLARIIKKTGGQGLAFDTIVASGKNSALPHYVSGNKKIKRGEVLLFDFGAKYQNYCADLSRTIFIGSAGDEQKNIYDLVQNAQDIVISKIKEGAHAKNIFQTAFKIFQTKKIEKQFIHGLGHGIGLEVHERPSLSKKSKDLLKTGMIYSVEPGLYFPSWGGVRIEDLVTLKNGRPEILGKHSTYIEIE